MKRRNFSRVSVGERRNADLFFADLMSSQSLPAEDHSEARFEADQFLADLFGAPSQARSVTEGHSFLPVRRIRALAEGWGEGASCPDREEIRETWRTLLELRKLLAKDKKEMESNPLVIEVQMLKALMEVLDTAKQVSRKVWGEIWNELKAFAACDVKPLVARVKKGEKHANAVLRTLNGLTSILQGYAHDQIDASVKTRLDAQTGFGKGVATVLIFLIKKQVPVIQREIKAGNFTAVATAFQDLKTELGSQGVSATGVWDIVVTLGQEIIGSAINDALENTARYAAKKVGKKLLGSAAKAASVIFILEEIALLVHALVSISNYKDRLWAFNSVILDFLARMRPCIAARPGGSYPAEVGWKSTIARMDCRFILTSFIPVKGGQKGEGEWKEVAIKGTLNGTTDALLRIDVPPAEAGPGRRDLTFQVPPVAGWPGKDNSFVALNVTTFNAAGAILTEKSLFMAACVA